MIPNITDVANSLHRSPGEVNKFFGTELGAQSKYTPENDKAVVNGAHTDAALQELMHRYIEKFVLCPNCRLPESEYKIKNECIFHRCKACGAKDMVDMSHKLCNFILAEDKKAKKEAKAKGKKAEKEDDKVSTLKVLFGTHCCSKIFSCTNSHLHLGNTSFQDAKKKKKSKDDSDDEKKKAKKEKKKDKKPKKDKKESEEENGNDKDYIKEALAGGKRDEDDLLANGHDDDDDDEDDSDDISEAGVDDAGALKLAVDATSKFLTETPDCNDAQLIELITNQQMASALKSHDKVHILVQSAFTEKCLKNKEIPRFAPAVIGITNKNKIMERHLIGALENLCIDKPKIFPVMIKLLYDEDALQEETILEWADEGRSEYTVVDEDNRAVLRGEAEPVVVWLQDSDSEDEDDDE